MIHIFLNHIFYHSISNIQENILAKSFNATYRVNALLLTNTPTKPSASKYFSPRTKISFRIGNSGTGSLISFSIPLIGYYNLSS